MIAQDHGVLGRPQPHAPDFHDRRSISDAWRPFLTVIMDGPAVQRLAFMIVGKWSLFRSYCPGSWCAGPAQPHAPDQSTIARLEPCSRTTCRSRTLARLAAALHVQPAALTPDARRSRGLG